MKPNRLTRALALVAVVGVLSAPGALSAAEGRGETRSVWVVLLDMLGFGPSNATKPTPIKKGPPIQPNDPGSCPSSGIHC